MAISVAMLSNAQSPEYEWAVGMGQSTLEYGWCIDADDSGNSYITGFFEGSVDFDPSANDSILTASGIRDCFVQKLDENGDLVWVVGFGDINTTQGLYVDVDADQNVYVTGVYSGTVDFDPGPGVFELTDVGSGDAFVLKLDANAELVWARSLGGSGNGEFGYSISVDNDGNVLSTGRFKGTADFDPGPAQFDLTSEGDNDVYVSKLDSMGNFVWAKSFGGSQFDATYALATDAAGNVFTAGAFQGQVDFDPGVGTEVSTSNGGFDIFLQKLNAAGDFQWVRTIGSSGTDVIRDVAIDPMGNVLTVGSFEGTVDFKPNSGTLNLISAGNVDAFVEKIDANGSVVWVNQLTSDSDIIGHGITSDSNGGVYVGGAFKSTADFDPSGSVFNGTAIGENDIFIQKMNAAGDFQWATFTGGATNDLCLSIAIDDNQNIYSTGYFEATVDFDPGSGVADNTSNGASDIFVLKLREPSSNTLGEHDQMYVRIFPNPTNSTLNIQSEIGINNLTIRNTLGQIVLNTTDKSIDVSSFENGVYLITISTDKGIVTKRFIKE